MINKTYSKYLTIFSILSICILVGFSIAANCNFTNPDWLFMDEDITFYPIQKIITALKTGKIIEFIYLVVDSGDLRYGKILWHINAFTSFIPTIIFGPSAQIIITRLTQSLILLASYYFLSVSFIKNKSLIYVTILILFLLPDTSYYASMPKPEPEQLFFLSLYFYIDSKKPKYIIFKWICLGAFLACKISSIPILMIIFLFEYYKISKNKGLNFKYISSIAALFVIGFLVTEPYFLMSVKYGFKTVVVNYLNSTIFNTTHGADNFDINYLSWIHFMVFDWLSMPFYIVLLGLLICITAIYLFIKQFNFSIIDIDKLRSIVLLSLGVISIMLIILKVERLWSYYLHIGAVLIVVAIFSMIENVLDSKEKFNINYKIFATIVLVVFISFRSYSVINEYYNFANRDKSLSHQQLLSEQKYINQEISSLLASKNHLIKVYSDPYSYRSIKNDSLVNIMYWGYFNQYNDNFDLIFIKDKSKNVNGINHPSDLETDFRIPKIKKDSHQDKTFQSKKNAELQYQQIVNIDKKYKIRSTYKSIICLEINK